MKSGLKPKTVLITAGPTWVPIDGVRVISNIATGKTGILLARKLKKSGAKVSLVLGPCQESFSDKSIKVTRFKFFTELEKILKKEIKKKYDIVIHSAAVSDYCLKNIYRKKIASDLKSISIMLVRTPKIINRIKKISPHTFLVGFKFETGISENGLKERAKGLIKNSDCDLVVANTFKNNKYLALITDGKNILGRARNKTSLADQLTEIII